MPKHRLINTDCLTFESEWCDTCFVDWPDNIGLGYASYKDKMDRERYLDQLSQWLNHFVLSASTVWVSYNSRWTFEIGPIVLGLIDRHGIEVKACVQTFTFAQCQQTDLADAHRPLLRMRWPGAPLFPDAVRVESWRQKNGDKRADDRGRVPTNHFDFPRVTGNSAQRRAWHPTQLHEGLVERCLRLTTPVGGKVYSPFAGTGTELRVCLACGFDSTSVEIDAGYCRLIAAEHGMVPVSENEWII